MPNQSIRLIVGLGNPGPEYETTRHNVGAWYVLQLAEQYDTNLRYEAKFFGQLAKISRPSEQFLLLFPSTYMNESGRSVAAVSRFYKIKPQEILVVHDELDFPAGTVRLKLGGGHGGHNGLRDIKQHLGGADFYRMRIGIGHPGHADKVTPYVLGTPSRSDTQKINQSIEEGLAILPNLLNGEMEKAFRRLHS